MFECVNQRKLMYALRSLKIIQGHRNMYQLKACDFLFVFHCNCKPIFYRFRDITIYW